MKFQRTVWQLGWVVALLVMVFGSPPLPLHAGIYEDESGATYKEIWVNHTEFTGGCDDLYAPNGTWFLEPGKINDVPCRKILDFQLPNDLAKVTKIEAYLDIWLGRAPQNVQFKLNGGVTRGAPVGFQFSRTPVVMELPKSEFRPGANTIQFWNQVGKYHIHDLAFRLHYAPGSPLPGETPPSATLLSISDGSRTVAPSAGGALNIDNDRITLVAGNVSADAKYIEFHAYYDGYDEDNDGVTRDWHNRDHNNCHPGATRNRCKLPANTGGSIDHIGTVAVGSAGAYTLVWQTPLIKAQTGVRFKLRVVDQDGNVRDAAGGVSAPFSLERTKALDTFLISGFQDTLLHADGKRPDVATYAITLPNDLSKYQKAYIVGADRKNPRIQINNSAAFTAFQPGEIDWALSVREVNINVFNPGQNTIKYLYNSGFGHLIEKPGPMIVLKQTSGGGGGGGGTATLRARKYRDNNSNGKRGSNEPWLANWTIKLYNSQGAEVGSQNTNGQGKVSFTTLATGDYTVCEILTAGWRNTQPRTINPTHNQPCYTVTLNAGQTVQVTFGNVRGASAADAVADDATTESGIVVFPPGVDGSAGDTDTDATWLATEDADEAESTSDAVEATPAEEVEDEENAEQAQPQIFMPVVKP